ncbi:D-Ala-D-Ala carboxypeptidase family metallohydrolase [Silvanigrella aquatica]|uniref:Peptidase M15A C-terminal domain-containing protein n=1 Tax=Silvanigrella aquatica TaxID=1915309 RepID=A0A1L4D190_9BACT|nr:D-Ala-D-Ala carboxypeptidase family metallohydrolase [Silvanigrella aquatica]APJ03950.1 hypothetical protein AXG55_08540 [Silvanigrella aquatica]
MHLSPHFTLLEFTKSEMAKKFNIENSPNEEQIENLKLICKNLLEPLREMLQEKIIILSGFRSFELNKKVGGVSNSQHLEGKAADIKVAGMNNFQLYEYIKDKFDFDQLILEYYNKNNLHAGWVHVSWNGVKNRKKFFQINDL